MSTLSIIVFKCMNTPKWVTHVQLISSFLFSKKGKVFCTEYHMGGPLDDNHMININTKC